jgi:hypothetical protein
MWFESEKFPPYIGEYLAGGSGGKLYYSKWKVGTENQKVQIYMAPLYICLVTGMYEAWSESNLKGGITSTRKGKEEIKKVVWKQSYSLSDSFWGWLASSSLLAASGCQTIALIITPYGQNSNGNAQFRRHACQGWKKSAGDKSLVDII